MEEKIIQNAELKIEYRDYDDYNVTEVVIDATLTINEDTWIIDAKGFDGEQTFQVVEERDKIMVAPIGEYGLSTTQTADYEPGTGRVEPQYLKHEDKYVNAIVGNAIDDTLGKIVSNARERFVSERGIQSAGEYDIPDIELNVRKGQPLFPSSKTGQTMAPRDRLVVTPQSDCVEFSRWHDAIVETTNRYEVWAGTPSKGTDKLLAPKGHEASDTLTLTEYLDDFYTVNPESVVEAVVPLSEVEKAKKEKAKSEKLKSENPEIRHVSIKNLDAFEEANKNGKKVKIADGADSCNEQRKQCDIDRIIYHATPEGEVEKSRVHTY